MLKLKILLIPLLVPSTLGQSIFAFGFFFLYLQILAFFLGQGSTNVECGIVETDKSIETISPSFFSHLKSITYYKNDPKFTYFDISTRFILPNSMLNSNFPYFMGSDIIYGLDLSTTEEEFKPFVNMVLSCETKRQIVYFGCVFNYHLITRLNILNDISVPLEQKATAFNEIVDTLPFYMEFQIPTIRPFLRIFEYPVDLDYFFSESVIYKGGVYKHRESVSAYDPYVLNQEHLYFENFKMVQTNILCWFKSKIPSSLETQTIETSNESIEALKQEIEDLTRYIQNQKLMISSASDKSINDNLRQTIEAKNQEMAKLKSTMENVLQQDNENTNDLITHINRKNDEINKRDWRITSLRLEVEKNNLRRDINYQYTGMAAMGMGIAITGGYLLSKCF